MRLFITSLIGVFGSGYLGLYEVLIEIAVIAWIVRDPKVVLGDYQESPTYSHTVGGFARRMFDWLADRKKRVLSGSIRGDTPFRDLVMIVLTGVLVGWGFTAVGLMFRPWTAVITREIAETAFDLVIFIPGLVLASEYFRVDLESVGDTVRFREMREQNPDDMGVSLWKMMHFQDIIAHGGYEYWEYHYDSEEDARAEERMAVRWRRLTVFVFMIFLLGFTAYYLWPHELLLLLEGKIF